MNLRLVRSLRLLCAIPFLALPSAALEDLSCPCAPVGSGTKLKFSKPDKKGGAFELYCTNAVATGDFVFVYKTPAGKLKTIGRCVFVEGENSTHPYPDANGNWEYYGHICFDGGADDGKPWDAIINLFCKDQCVRMRLCMNYDGTKWVETSRDFVTKADYDAMSDADADGDGLPDEGVKKLTEGLYPDPPPPLPANYEGKVSLVAAPSGFDRALVWSVGSLNPRLEPGDTVLIEGISSSALVTLDPSFSPVDTPAGLELVVNSPVSPTSGSTLAVVLAVGGVRRYQVEEQGSTALLSNLFALHPSVPLDALVTISQPDLSDFPGYANGAGFVDLSPTLSCDFGIQSNNVTYNNGGDVVFLYSSPSSGFTAAANPPDVAGDWYYKCYTGAGTLNHVTHLGPVMEVDGFYESLFDTFWGTIGSPASSSADFYERTLGPAVASTVNPGILEPLFASIGFTTEALVIVGNSGFGNPCTVAPSLCSPPGSTCPPTGFVNGYLVELNFSSTCGTGVVLPADGTAASDTAVTYFVTGGMTATGGVCGLGDYGIQDVHSTNETQADLAGGLNIDGGFQLGGGGPLAEAVVSMLEAHLTFRDRIVQPQADTAGGGVEVGDNGGGATNGRRLSVSSGLSTLGIELRDRATASSGVPNIAVSGLSLTPIPNPGVPVFGGQANLLVVPDGVFNATAVPGVVAPTVFVFTSEGAYTGPQFPIPPGAGVTLYAQGIVVDVTFVPFFRSTNSTSTILGP